MYLKIQFLTYFESQPLYSKDTGHGNMEKLRTIASLFDKYFMFTIEWLNFEKKNKMYSTETF